MDKQIRKDIMGVIPKIGDVIIYNPPYYKGIVKAKVTGFSKTGLPITDYLVNDWNKNPTPKTGFVIIKNNE
jgi:hypothetical protein